MRQFSTSLAAIELAKLLNRSKPFSDSYIRALCARGGENRGIKAEKIGRKSWVITEKNLRLFASKYLQSSNQNLEISNVGVLDR